MLLSKVKDSLQYRLKPERKLPEDDLLQDFVFEALIYVANRCDPAELEVSQLEDSRYPLKHINGGKMILEPQYPDFSDIGAHLNIDGTLSYAVVNYTCFLVTNKPEYKMLSDEDIGLYRAEYSRIAFGDEEI